MSTLSVIIPTFNRLHTLDKALRSGALQNIPDMEIIVVDDGSTDGTGELLTKEWSQVRYLYIEHSGLPAVARNKGLAAAKSDYVAFLDSDDEWLPGKIARQVSILANNPNVGLVCSNAVVRRGDAVDMTLLPAGKDYPHRALTELLSGNFVITSTVVIRRSVLKQTGGFPEAAKFIAIEDYHLWLRIAAIYDVIYIDDCLAVYRDAPSESIRGRVSLQKHYESMIFLMQDFASFLYKIECKDDQVYRAIDKQVQTFLTHIINLCRTHSDYAQLLRLSIRQPFCCARYFGNAVQRKLRLKSNA